MSLPNYQKIIFFFLLVLSAASVAQAVAAPTIVQFNSGDGGATSTTTNYLSQAVAAGDVLCAFGHWDSQTITVTSVTDSAGNVYTSLSGPTNFGSSARGQFWCAKNVAASAAPGVTFHYSGVTTSFSLNDVFEISGLDPSSPVDVMHSASGTGTMMDTGAAPPVSYPNELIVGMFLTSGYVYPFSPGVNFAMNGQDASSILESMVVSSIVSPDATATPSDLASWLGLVVGFKAAGQSSTPPPPPTFPPCDVNGDGVVNVVDVQLEVNLALGITTPCPNADGCTVVQVQRVVNAALGGTCVAP